jgi:hypothetical protein
MPFLLQLRFKFYKTKFSMFLYSFSCIAQNVLMLLMIYQKDRTITPLNTYIPSCVDCHYLIINLQQ